MATEPNFTNGEILTAEELNLLIYKLPKATADTLGGIMIGDNLTMDVNGKLSAVIPESSGSGYTLPRATRTLLGGVIVGDRLSINAEGVLSADVQATGGGTGETYVLPPATETTLGGMIVGDNLAVDGAGRVSAIIPEGTGGTTYTLPPATTSTLGGIIAGDNVTIDETGRLSATVSGGPAYTLPAATTDTLGGIIVGDNLTIDAAGRLSSNPGNYSLPTASSSVLGGVKIGANLSIDVNGVLSANAGNYTLPPATTQTLGGIIAGAGCTINSSGVLSVSATGGLGNVTFSDYVTSRGRASPPAPESGWVRTIKDQLTSQVVNTSDFFDHTVYKDRALQLNQILAYCQDIAHITMSRSFYSFTAGCIVTCYTPIGEIPLRYTVVVPGNVEWDCRAKLIRDNSSNGSFSDLYLPAIVVTPFAHLRNTTLIGHINGTKGCGIVVGRSFLADAYTKVNSGSGYKAGQVLTLERFGNSVSSENPFKNTKIRVDTVDGAGAIQAYTVTSFGSYDISLQVARNQGHFSDGNVTGSGAVFRVTSYESNWENGRYRRGPGGIFCQTVLTDVNVIEPGEAYDSDATKGYMFGIAFVGLNHEIHRAYVKGGRVGFSFSDGSDVRINNLNTVLSGTAVRVFGYGAITCSNFALDSNWWCGMEFTGCSGQAWFGRIFWENANSNRLAFNPDGTANPRGRPNGSGYAIKFGDGGASGQLISGFNINLQCTNSGGYNKSQPLAFVDRLTKSEINLQCTNSEYSGKQDEDTMKVSTLYHFSTATGLLQSDNRFSGSIAHISGPVYTGDPKNNDLDIFDAFVGGVCGPRGVYVITGNYVPTNGTSGTGAGKAENGSEFRKCNGSAPYRYINTGTKASPQWTALNIN